MTPEQASDIYQAARMAEYRKHQANYTPVNQRKTVLAGFQAVIDAVTREVDTSYAKQLLSYDFTGERGVNT